MFSNDSQLYEEFLDCFYDKKENENECIKLINELKEKIEKKYEVKFNFDSNFLDFPKLKNIQHFSDLTFEDWIKTIYKYIKF